MDNNGHISLADVDLATNVNRLAGTDCAVDGDDDKMTVPISVSVRVLGAVRTAASAAAGGADIRACKLKKGNWFYFNKILIKSIEKRF